MGKRKPYDPAQAAQQALERAEREAEKRRLQALGATVNTDRTGRVLSAYRSNVFNLLLSRKTITQNQHNAAHTLATDWAAWKGLDGKADISPGRIDDAATARSLVTDRMLFAGNRVAEALRAVPPIERLVLEALMVATVEDDRPMAWRGIVERAVKVTRRPRQVELVVAGLEALREHYEGPRTQHRVAA